MSSDNEPNTSPSGSTQSVQASLEEAAEEFLPGMGRLEVARKAVLIDDLRRLARDDRESVRRYRDRTLFGQRARPSTEEEPVGDMIVAETIHVERSDRPRGSAPAWLALIAVLALLGFGLGSAGIALYSALNRPGTMDTWTEFDVQKFAPD